MRLCRLAWTPSWMVLMCGVILVTCPTMAHARTVTFAGQEWTVRSGDGGPGPNHWSDSAESVWVDQEGLHLKIRKVGDVWHCAEVTSVLPTRHGMHRFYIASRTDLLDKNVVASPFLYKDDTREVDIEFSTWQKSSGNNTQYVVQPYQFRGNIHRFEVKPRRSQSTHYFDWRADSIHFKIFQGHGKEPCDRGRVFQDWTYVGKDNPPESDALRVHINLWLVKGTAPSDRKEVEFIVKDADLPGPPSDPAATGRDTAAGGEQEVCCGHQSE